MTYDSSSVSVVIPTYRRPESLLRAVKSVLAQTVLPLEVIVVDDNRDDEAARQASYQLVGDVHPAVRVINHSGTSGGSAARNTGAEAASGTLIAFLDDDDWWLPRKLERQLEVLRQSERLPGLVFTGLRVVDTAGALIRNRIGSVSQRMEMALARSNVIGTVSSVLIPKPVFRAVGGFDPNLPARQDLDLWLRIAHEWDIAVVPEPLTVYLNHQQGISKNFDKKIRAHDLFLQKHAELYTRHPRLVADYHYATALLCAKHKQFRMATDFLAKSLRVSVTTRAWVRYVQFSMMRIVS